MIAARWALLLLTALGVLAGVGATAADYQPSAQRLAVTAVLALLAPLYWPGPAATPERTALRVLLWSAAVAVAAAAVLRVLGHAGQPWLPLLASSEMLLCVLLPVHAAAASLQALLAGRLEPAVAREAASRSVALALALLMALPLWLGPVAELLLPQADWAVDAALAASPLTHLAVAAGNDLLRQEWLYEHANLATLDVSYPDPGTTVWVYAALALALVAATVLRSRRAAAAPEPVHSTPEQTR